MIVWPRGLCIRATETSHTAGRGADADVDAEEAALLARLAYLQAKKRAAALAEMEKVTPPLKKERKDADRDRERRGRASARASAASGEVTALVAAAAAQAAAPGTGPPAAPQAPPLAPAAPAGAVRTPAQLLCLDALQDRHRNRNKSRQFGRSSLQ